MEYRVRYFIDESEIEEISYYSVFHSSEALDFLAHTFSRGHIQGDVLHISHVEEYDRFRNSWGDRTSYAQEYAVSDKIISDDSGIVITSNVTQD